MIKWGFEVEAFIRPIRPILAGGPGPFALVPSGLPYDECGWLVEVRSEPHTDVRKAIALLEVEIRRVVLKARQKDFELLFVPYALIPRTMKVEAARIHTKGLIKFRNVYGHQTHRVNSAYGTAALHVSITDTRTFQHFAKGSDQQRDFSYPAPVDHASLIATLDRSFKSEIKAAKRNPGFYEIKADGRIEYRSLPNNVSLQKLAEVLEEWKP